MRRQALPHFWPLHPYFRRVLDRASCEAWAPEKPCLLSCCRAHRPLPQAGRLGPLLATSSPNPICAHPEAQELAKHGAHVAGVGPQECPDQLLLPLAQPGGCLLCPTLGLLCSPQCQGFCRQDHCAQARGVTELLRPEESTSLCQLLTRHVARRGVRERGGSRGLPGLG